MIYMAGLERRPRPKPKGTIGLGLQGFADVTSTVFGHSKNIVLKPAIRRVRRRSPGSKRSVNTKNIVDKKTR